MCYWDSWTRFSFWWCLYHLLMLGSNAVSGVCVSFFISPRWHISREGGLRVNTTDLLLAMLSLQLYGFGAVSGYLCLSVCVCVCVCVSCISPGVGSHSLLQGIFPTQGLNPDLLLCRQILYRCVTWEAPCLSLFMSKMSILYQMTPWILTRYSVICLLNEGQHFEVWSYPFQIASEPTIWESIRIPFVQTFFPTLCL